MEDTEKLSDEEFLKFYDTHDCKVGIDHGCQTCAEYAYRFNIPEE